MAAMPRCLGCGYFLHGLPEPRCPECGREFNLDIPSTYSLIPPLIRWRYWLPGFALALGGGFIAYITLILTVGFGWAVTLVLPFCLGAIIGYGCRVRIFVSVLLSIVILFVCVMGLFTLNILGVFCALVMSGVALGPLLVGTVAGAMLRQTLKMSNWDQRWYLPLMSLLLTPLLWSVIEFHFHERYADETVVTTMTMPVNVGHAWNAVMFYEDVPHPRPLLLRFALPTPLYTRGQTEHVGDIKVCVYSKGRLVKRVISRDINHELDFDVIEQTHIENRSVRLEGGSFEFLPQNAVETEVKLTTRYEPLLGPRWAWRPFERLGMTTLHQYVLEGMRLKSIADDVPKENSAP